MDPVDLIKNIAIIFALLVACMGYYKAEMSRSTIELLKGERDALAFKVTLLEEDNRVCKDNCEKQAGKIEVLENLVLKGNISVKPSN